MRLKADIIERLEELDESYIPREAGGAKKYGEAKSLLWVLEIDHGPLVDGKCLNLEEYIPDE